MSPELANLFNLVGAHIGGNLSFDGARLTNPEDVALNADGLTVDQSLFCGGFSAQGEVRLTGAHVGGRLSFAGASLINPGGFALTADRITVGQSFSCVNGFSAQGEIRLVSAHVGGQLNLGLFTCFRGWSSAG